MTLNEWQERLTTYFTELRSTLDAAGNLRPIFAIEHDLSPTDLDDLTVCLRAHTSSTGPAVRHYHAWSVYAAEIGYKFKGDEYWQTFAQDLPAWRREDHDCIKDAFYAFRRQFRGAVPAGSWAKNFTIISWPITHAVLPKDLQRRLARVLYEVRGAFTPSLLSDTTSLGRLIAANSDGTSSRFQKFVEEYELVGRISVALLSPESEAAAGLLAPHTLRRIAADLQAEQSAHEWLTAARQRASSIKMNGLRTRIAMPGVSLTEPLETELKASEQASGERLELVAKQTGEESWSVSVLLPNLSHIESANASYQRVFASQRGFIDVSGKSHFAPRYFAVNRQEIALKDWPVANQSILRFEPSPVGLSEALDECCSLPRITNALFRLREDGTGIYVKSKVVRPGETYVLVSTEDFPSTTYVRESKRINIDCKDVHGILLDVPDRISDLYHEAIRSLGLGVSIALNVSPAGYPPKSWNEDGDVEWFVSSPQVLAISSTVEVKELVLNLVGDDFHDVIQVPMDGYGPVYVDLEITKIGQYQLHLVAKVPSIQEGVVTGTSLVSVLPDDDIILNSENAQGFAVLAVPTLPTLEELWAGAAKINLYGPNGAQLKTQLTFHSDPAGLSAPTLTHSLGRVALPLEETEWAALFGRAKRDKKVMAAQEDAVSCRLSWRSIELGESSLQCEREFVPLRWSVRTKSNHHKVRLIQNDSTRKLTLTKASFRDPSTLIPFVLGPRFEFDQSDEGGLFVARTESASASVILTCPAHNGFGALMPAETRIPPARNGQALLSFCDAFGLWTEAEFTDDPILRRKRDAAVGVLKTAILESICGGPWVSAEVGLEKGRLSVNNLCGMIGQARDYKFHRSLSEAIPFAGTFSNDEIASVALDLAQSSNLLRGSEAIEVTHHDVVTYFSDFLDRDIAIGQAWTNIGVSGAAVALTETSLMQIMRLLMLARQHMQTEARSFAAVSS